MLIFPCNRHKSNFFLLKHLEKAIPSLPINSVYEIVDFYNSRAGGNRA
jgi:hypothetical protein